MSDDKGGKPVDKPTDDKGGYDKGGYDKGDGKGEPVKK
jgi:hypothetical protein